MSLDICEAESKDFLYFVNGNYIYVTFSQCVYTSTDCINWQRISTGNRIVKAIIDFYDGYYYYICGINGNIYRTSNFNTSELVTSIHDISIPNSTSCKNIFYNSFAKRYITTDSNTVYCSNVCSNPSEITSFTKLYNQYAPEVIPEFTDSLSFYAFRRFSSRLDPLIGFIDFDTNKLDYNLIQSDYGYSSSYLCTTYNSVTFCCYTPTDTSEQYNVLFAYPNSHFVLNSVVPTTDTITGLYSTSKYFLISCNDGIYIALNDLV